MLASVWMPARGISSIEPFLSRYSRLSVGDLSIVSSRTRLIMVTGPMRRGTSLQVE